jgi:hypothetical protein
MVAASCCWQNAGHKAGVAINEGMDNDMPSSQACSPQSAWAGTEKTLMTHHAAHCSV